MTAFDRGAVLIIDTGGYNLLGATCELLAAPGFSNLRGRALSLTPIVISDDGMTASYTQTGKDFTEGGFWQFQLQVRTADGQNLTSQPSPLYVYPKLRGW